MFLTISICKPIKILKVPENMLSLQNKQYFHSPTNIPNEKTKHKTYFG